MLNFTLVRRCTNAAAIIVSFISSVSVAWEVDLSRRFPASSSAAAEERPVVQVPASAGQESLVVDQEQVTFQKAPAAPSEAPGFFDKLLSAPSEPSQEVVILNTDQGFIPATVHLRRDTPYRIRIVNVNSKEKNTSFVLDAFSEHHATYFGQVKTFEVNPKAEGIFAFQCPETAATGKIVVMGASVSRIPAGSPNP